MKEQIERGRRREQGKEGEREKGKDRETERRQCNCALFKGFLTSLASFLRPPVLSFLLVPSSPSLSLLLPQCREVGCDRNTQYAHHYVSRRDCGDISTYRRTVPRNCPQHGHKSYVGGGGYIY